MLEDAQGVDTCRAGYMKECLDIATKRQVQGVEPRWLFVDACKKANALFTDNIITDHAPDLRGHAARRTLEN